MYYEISFKSTTVIFSWPEVAFCRDIPKVKNPGIWGFSEFSTRDFFGIFKSWSWFPGFWGLFRDFQILNPGLSGFLGFCTRDFSRFSNPYSDPRGFEILGIFSGFSNLDSDSRAFGIFGILHSEFFRDF